MHADRQRRCRYRPITKPRGAAQKSRLLLQANSDGVAFRYNLSNLAHLFWALSVDCDWTEVWLATGCWPVSSSIMNHRSHFTIIIEHRLTFYSHGVSYLKHQVCICINTCAHISSSPSPAEHIAECWSILMLPLRQNAREPGRYCIEQLGPDADAPWNSFVSCVTSVALHRRHQLQAARHPSRDSSHRKEQKGGLRCHPYHKDYY
jgi:hypothetical protein